jgi:hydroxyethylthiazole kinase
MKDRIAKNLEELRRRRPLVQNITNFVVMNTTANALLSIGASPVMAHAVEELEDMLKLADALVINIGTLDGHWIRSMERAVEIADNLKKPVILDPVGAGATRLRTEISLKLLESGAISILRGNFGEIKALLGEHGATRGVDSAEYDIEGARNLALKASEIFGCTVAVTGKVDYVSNGSKIFSVMNGHEMLERVTGTGCMVSSIIGAFSAVDEPLYASISALVVFGVCAEKSYEEAPYPGSFHLKLYDWLYRIDGELIEEKGKVEEIEA